MVNLESVLLAVEKIESKLLRPAMKQKVHTKFISQEFFVKLSHDLNHDFQSPVFSHVVTDRLMSFLSSVESKNMKVILSGNSDYSLTDDEYEILTQQEDKIFFVQNLDSPETKNVFSLPIGIEDLKWAKNGMPWNFTHRLSMTPKRHQVLVGPFRATHQQRDALMKFESNSTLHSVARPLAAFRYARLAASFEYVACPRGNGIDTHRFWETLYRGGVPIVLESQWARNMEKNGVPLVQINSWDELGNLKSIDFKHRTVRNINFLHVDWWKSRLLALTVDS